ncbi:Hydrogenase/urease accessory protein HupE [Andreprevotia lacus DSM 23236]|jgi:urease accessory protein|uniref:Hydrogenase/urease accessory protein HupE n=1 Tax=Andreprevotia lacus DSM 23236 TaxID=1121001 RepID=A0A1W1Y123_9NEIS|nr:HupE/UreJ family protein [Andreprevotia lacus]SMC29856.1 Hydrogenase/urease accessory protein HupE [Andreprevotia lacus DSM 23236]
MRAARLLLLAGTLFALVSPSCLAHAALQGAGDFYAGALHPLTSPEHMLPLLLIGLLAGQNGHRTMSFTLLVLPLSLAIGAAVSFGWPRLPGSFLGCMALAMLLGGLLALAWRLPRSAVGLLAAACGLIVGYANGSAISADMQPVVFVAGLMAVGFLLQAYGMALVSALLACQRGWLTIAIRVLGSWSVAIGLLVISLSHRALLLA